MSTSTAQVNLRMDESLKKEVERIFDELGMNLTTGFTVMAKAVVRNGGFPFELMVDPFEKKEMQDELRRRIEEKEEGKSKLRQVVKTMEELERELYG